MTPQQIKLIQDSWAELAPASDTVAAIFYAKLFELDPSLRPLFKHDLAEQGRKLMTVLSVAVNSLDNLEQILPAVQALGQRHAGYGVKDEHYQTVGIALLWTLQQGLDERFTAELKQAWAQAYGILSSVMQEAASTEAA